MTIDEQEGDRDTMLPDLNVRPGRKLAGWPGGISPGCLIKLPSESSYNTADTTLSMKRTKRGEFDMNSSKSAETSTHVESPARLQPGDILIFKRNERSRTSRILGWVVKHLEHDWDGWGWHMGYVRCVGEDGSIDTVESLRGQGVEDVRYPTFGDLGEVRIYRWFDGLDDELLESFTNMHMGEDYDIACYFWTSLQRLLVPVTHHLIPRIINNRYTCWELVCDMARAMNKPLQPAEQYPLIADMERALEPARIV